MMEPQSQDQKPSTAAQPGSQDAAGAGQLDALASSEQNEQAALQVAATDPDEAERRLLNNAKAREVQEAYGQTPALVAATVA